MGKGLLEKEKQEANAAQRVRKIARKIRGDPYSLVSWFPHMTQMSNWETTGILTKKKSLRETKTLSLITTFFLLLTCLFAVMVIYLLFLPLDLFKWAIPSFWISLMCMQWNWTAPILETHVVLTVTWTVGP